MQATKTQQLRTAIGPVDSLPTLPASVSRLQDLVEKGEGDSSAVAEAVAADAAIVARVMRVANSAAHQGAQGPTESLPDAVIRLGFSAVRDLALTTAVVERFGAMADVFDYRAFWDHCGTTAVAAGYLASLSALEGAPRRGRSVIGGPYYLAGLLHDVGVLVCLERLGDRYSEVLQKNAVVGEPLFATERSLLGFDHGQVGAYLADSWGLSESVGAAAEWHHFPLQSPASHRKLVCVVHLADWITHHLGLGNAGDGTIERFEDQAWGALRLDLAQFDEVVSAFLEAADEGRTVIGSVRK